MSHPFGVVLIVLMLPLFSPAVAQHVPDAEATREQYAEDFDVFWQFVSDEYAYFEKKQTDWPRVRSLYRPEAVAAPDDRAFLNVLERAIGELYDPHAGFDTHNPASPRLVPSGTDLWAAWRDGQATVTDVRAGSAAEKAGLQPDMVVRTIGGRPVEEAVQHWMPRTLKTADPAARDWALRAALAGTHAHPVQLTVETAGGRMASFEFTPGVERPSAPLTLDTLRNFIGYVRVNNSLGDIGLIAAFDSALASLRDTRGLVLDLRDTPSGGNTTVARGIMSRLLETDQPYQRHEYVAEERDVGVRRVWVEYVAPRGAFAYTQPVVVLVGRWTGSMGEGIVIGLDGMGRATVAGTPMAGLNGAISGRTLPNTGIGVRIPTEQLIHVDGSPRESFVPAVVALSEQAANVDVALEQALELLNSIAEDRSTP